MAVKSDAGLVLGTFVRVANLVEDVGGIFARVHISEELFGENFVFVECSGRDPTSTKYGPISCMAAMKTLTSMNMRMPQV